MPSMHLTDKLYKRALGMECFAAQVVKFLKTVPGDLYIMTPNTYRYVNYHYFIFFEANRLHISDSDGFSGTFAEYKTHLLKGRARLPLRGDDYE
jgi:hypothetical protein